MVRAFESCCQTNASFMMFVSESDKTPSDTRSTFEATACFVKCCSCCSETSFVILDFSAHNDGPVWRIKTLLRFAESSPEALAHFRHFEELLNRPFSWSVLSGAVNSEGLVCQILSSCTGDRSKFVGVICWQ
jgi:hypothetical protein